FYLKGVAPPHVKLEDIFKGCMPFIYIVIFCMIMVYIFPGLVTWLPETLYGSAPVDPAASTALDSPPVGGFQEVEEIALPPLN
ncbi:MAG: C4-dicarboxylate ABC transporter, partial [Roseomonas sp.]|nr:C4-dicarboxylate ABC transporter [Roseomonas sp.]